MIGGARLRRLSLFDLTKGDAKTRPKIAFVSDYSVGVAKTFACWPTRTGATVTKSEHALMAVAAVPVVATSFIASSAMLLRG